ncbi:UDP-N-acetylglucosamine--LPS N-acetylglucosamine transferase [Ornithinimicrobium sp. INDO-MA30-4]|uniref:UDP-N-acetylglucosamine--LPS N-acetylglucosamine transferase n=1 Tax=Ornithinimicrobium sp. INDO-MA30-4 TaxID=2908651 RepID=UPI001F19E9FF|nr:UDP-N-acetylglucosamine--LPS N-acetylglucosamine transferase [Ornithinimicrobium sp. INDO-MA30-4]UJH70096.1 UDP-N-acetylglucosamine--LPS N-acetylglucosamine transferase [Ornithinimicrobium sp. INDO-MA30-4]
MSANDPLHHDSQRRAEGLATPFGLDPDLHVFAQPLPEPPSPLSPALMMSSNGTGMGHLMRLLAIAMRMPAQQAVSFMSLSGAADVIERTRYAWEHMSSYRPGFSGSAWERQLAARLRTALDQSGAGALIFDGAAPYRGLRMTAAEHPDVTSVWMRRGLWKEGLGGRHLRHSDAFDLIIEPGELDGRLSVPDGGAISVGPVTLVSHDQVLSRAEARQVLGLDPSRPTLLLSLGAGKINDTSSVARTLIDAIAETDWLVMVPSNPLAVGQAPDNVRTFRSLPMAHLMPAFDGAVAAAGYNSAYELLNARVPSLFLPNTATGIDDQTARAQMFADAGVGLIAQNDPTSALEGLQQLLDISVRTEMKRNLDSLNLQNGAAAAARLITEAVAR